MGFIRNKEIEDEYIGKYGVVVRRMPVNEGYVTTGSVIHIDRCYREQTHLIYSMTEIETGAKVTVPKAISEISLVCVPFLDENFENITLEGVIFFGKQFSKLAHIEMYEQELGSITLLGKWLYKLEVKKLMKQVLKKYSIKRNIER